jgi:hypothetical protein
MLNIAINSRINNLFLSFNYKFSTTQHITYIKNETNDKLHIDDSSGRFQNVRRQTAVNHLYQKVLDNLLPWLMQKAQEEFDKYKTVGIK